MSTTTATETGKIQPRLKQKYNAEIKKALQDELHAGVRCLVKGSRGSAMDLIVKALLAQGEESPHVV